MQMKLSPLEPKISSTSTDGSHFSVPATLIFQNCGHLKMATTLCFPSYSLSRTTNSVQRIPLKPRAVLSSSGYKMGLSYPMKQGQSRLFHELPSGLKMEVITQKAKIPIEDKREKGDRPPLVFIHGSFHAGWCWAENWLPFFSNHGFDCYALSLLAQVCLPSISLTRS